MKKLSMLLSVAVCSIGLFQSVKGMDAPPITIKDTPKLWGAETKDQLEKQELFKKYLLEKHLLEASLPKDLVLFIRQLQAVIKFFDQEVKKLKDAEQQRFEAGMKPIKEKQERIERQLRDASLPKDYRALIMRGQEANIQAAEDAQKRNQQRQEQIEAMRPDANMLMEAMQHKLQTLLQ